MKRFALVIAAIFAVSLAAACDDSVTYQPAAYGQQVALQPGQTYQTATDLGFQTITVSQPQNSWICWLADDYHEAALLMASGACPNTWVPILMASLSQGLLWHQMYAPYYDSYGYYGRYVPSAYRSTYVQHVTVFETRYKTEIVKQSQSSTAKYKGSDGKPASGQAVSQRMASGQAQFGSGQVRSSGFASKTTQQATTKSVTAANAARTNSGSTTTRSGSSSSFGSGAARSGGGSSSFGGGSTRSVSAPVGRK